MGREVKGTAKLPTGVNVNNAEEGKLFVYHGLQMAATASSLGPQNLTKAREAGVTTLSLQEEKLDPNQNMKRVTPRHTVS